MFCMYFRKKTIKFSLYSINWLVFITEQTSVYCAVRTGCLKNGLDFVLMWLKNVHRTSVGIRHEIHITVRNTAAAGDRLMGCVADEYPCFKAIRCRHHQRRQCTHPHPRRLLPSFSPPTWTSTVTPVPSTWLTWCKYIFRLGSNVNRNI